MLPERFHRRLGHEPRGPGVHRSQSARIWHRNTIALDNDPPHSARDDQLDTVAESDHARSTAVSPPQELRMHRRPRPRSLPPSFFVSGKLPSGEDQDPLIRRNADGTLHCPVNSLSTLRSLSTMASSSAINLPQASHLPHHSHSTTLTYQPSIRVIKEDRSSVVGDKDTARGDISPVRVSPKQFKTRHPPPGPTKAAGPPAPLTFGPHPAVRPPIPFMFGPHPAVRPLEGPQGWDHSCDGPAHCTDGVSTDATTYPAPLPLSLILLGICLSVFIISLDRNIITTAIPNITAQFHSYDDIGWYGSAYLLTASAFQPLYGRIYMSFATKSSFLVALAVFELGSLVAATSGSSEALIVGRAVQGLGSAGLLTGAFVVGTHSVRLQHRPLLFAAVGILYGVGALSGPLLGGVFTDTIGWRWCFWINVPIGAFTFVTVFFFFRHKTPTAVGPAAQPFAQRVIQLDLFGNLILLSATVMLFLALQFSEQGYAWSSAHCIGLLCGCFVTTLVFIAWIWYRGDSALIPPRIIRQRTVAASCGAAVAIYGALLVHSYYLPIWFQAVKGASAIRSGVDMIPYMVTNALFSLFAGIFVSKRGLFAPPAILGCAIATVGSGLLITLDPSTPASRWIGFEVLISVGLGMSIQQGFSAVQASLPLHAVPIGTAAVVAAQSLGGAVFVSVANTLLQNRLLTRSLPGMDLPALFKLGATQFRHAVPPSKMDQVVMLYNNALQDVFTVAVPLCGLAFLCSLCMEWKSLRPEGSERERQQQQEGEKA